MYAKKIPSDCYNKGIRCILKQIREYTKPESLWHWCAEVKPSDVKAENFYSGLRYRLSVIEYLKAYTLIEKVQLIFIFGRPIIADFVKMLTDAKCTVQLDEKGRITYFCSEDGSVVRESDHRKMKREIRKMKREEQELLGPHSEIIPENAKRSAIKRYSKPPENVHYWKSEPHFEHSYFEHQNAPFDGRINYDELDVKPVIFGNRCLQNSIDGKRMKIEEPEDPFADFSTDFSATSSRNIQAREALKESKISVLLLAIHIETTALYFEYKNLEIQASRAVEKIKESGREMALSLREFDNFIEAMLTSIKRARIPRTESNLQLKTVFKHIKLSLIRPFGPEVTGEALTKLVERKFKKNL
ncbi:hypothetical protein L5515_009341 [Caenorhabditis briggsae]|uniref:SPK domain-containing protein n=1 Tax=Caenorhabditis briggsae TaxID=6238 RepID=A0AAE9JM46_CAEBR|nr:hypothetical protein L5515_009341 [Caenorhabditis briggsae]